MRKRWGKRQLLYNYFISYIIILFIPMIILMTTFKCIGVQKFKEELFEKDIASLRVATYNLEKILMTCQNVASQIEDKYYPFELSSSITSAIGLIDLLKEYVIASEIYDKIFVVFPDKDYFYYNGSSMRKDEFFNRYIPKGISIKEFERQLESTLVPTLVNNIVYENERYMFYDIPYFADNEIVGQVLFMIKESNLYDILGSESQNVQRINRLIGLDKLEENYEHAMKEHELEEYKEEIYQSLEGLSQQRNYGAEFSEGNSIYIALNRPFNIAYIAVTNNQEIFEELVILKNVMLVIGILSIMIGMIVIWWLVRCNYRPIQQLNRLSSQFNHQDKTYNNEIEFIKQTITYLSQKNEKLENEFKKNIPIKQKFLVDKVVNGTIGEMKFFEEECIEANIKLKANYYCILSVSCYEINKKDIDILVVLRKRLKNILKIEYAYVVKVLVNKTLIILVGVASRGKINRQVIESNEMKIVIGDLLEDIASVPRFYVNVKAYLELNQFKETLINQKTEIEKYLEVSGEAIEQVQLLIREGSMDQLRWAINKLLDIMDELMLPIPIARNTYCEIINIFNEYFKNVKRNHMYKEIEINVFYTVKDKKHLRKLFLELSNEAINMIIKSNKKISIKLNSEQIKEFIKKNYTAPEFSIQLIADEFDTSISYLSQYFKEHMKITILEYSTLLRIEKAKEIMEFTHCNIQEVSDQIGYNNVSSFSRRFKQVTGQTPGEFKKALKLE